MAAGVGAREPHLGVGSDFGGSALPAAARAGLGFSLAVAIAPALRPVVSVVPFPLALALESVRGLPIAVGAAVLVHTALMVGGVVDDLRGARPGATLPVFDAEHTPFGALFGLLVAVAMLLSGAPARLIGALAQLSPSLSLRGVIDVLTASTGIALAVAAPVLGVVLILSVAEALLARAASPAHVSQLLGPLRSVVLLAVLALLFERMQEALLLTLGV
ncbi:MAG: flagellar biosynthetic protein FliR [Polyangiaceae bacterium]